MREVSTTEALIMIETGTIKHTIDTGSMQAHEILTSDGRTVRLIGDVCGRFILAD